jgi:hypothetical protein
MRRVSLNGTSQSQIRTSTTRLPALIKSLRSGADMCISLAMALRQG